MPFTVLDTARRLPPNASARLSMPASSWELQRPLLLRQTVAASGILLQQRKDKTPHSSGRFSSLQTLLNFTALALKPGLLRLGLKTYCWFCEGCEVYGIQIMCMIHWIYYSRAGFSSELQTHTHASTHVSHLRCLKVTSVPTSENGLHSQA